ncbi:HAD hydrolase family protein [Oscillatoria amoena NRMC-F 0135]|nr:HAD hydrolase family protein [Oscillatoria laete-virens]MDL5046601.1 HAD hydrolase family protein [Oscillatoria amoena NRMC-F 0135]MDL5053590.1 HAD hydrolase family protein [Oscillatoria laete-virens NRMC-F 0139]
MNPNFQLSHDFLFVSDIDGTLINSSGFLSDYSRAELRKLLGEGMPFTVASGRGLVEMRDVIDGIPFELPVVEKNGSYITDFHSGKHLLIRDMDRDITGQVIERSLAEGISPFFFCSDGNDDLLFHAPASNPRIAAWLDARRAKGDARLREVPSLKVHESVLPVCLTTIGPREVVERLLLWIQETHPDTLRAHAYADPYGPGWWWIEIHDYFASKGHGLETLCSMAGLDMARVTVVGDESNDVPMFRMAGHSAAMANAPDEVKHFARETIGCNDDDSAVKYFRKLWDAAQR